MDSKSTAAQRFFGTTELVLEISKNIPSRQQRSKLCLVCKSWDGIFSSVLFRHITITLNPRNIIYTIALFAQRPPTKLQHTRSITVVMWGSFAGWGEDTLFVRLFLRLLPPIFNESPTLRAIRYDGDLAVNTLALLQMTGNPNDHEHSPALECLRLGVLRNDRNFLALSNGEEDTSLNQHFGFNGMEYLGGGRPTDVSFPTKRIGHLPWHNLKSLQVTSSVRCQDRVYLDAEVAAAGSCVADILARCTNLEYLSLRLELADALYQFPNFGITRAMCLRYRTVGGTPLKLKVLILGAMMTLEARDEAGNSTGMEASYLRYLTETEGLEDFRFRFRPGCRMAWHEISPSRMPKLQHLGVGTLDQSGHDYFTTPAMAAFLRRIHLSISQPGHYLQNRSRLPAWQHRPVWNVLDMFNSEGQHALQPRGLEVDLTTLDVRRRPVLRAAPWPWLKHLKVVVPVASTAFLGRVANTFLKNIVGLEALVVEFKNPNTNTENDHGLDEGRLRCMARRAARRCPRLEYVAFLASWPLMPLFRGRMRTFRFVRKTVGRKKPRVTIEVVELDRDVAEREIPEVFWPEGAKMARFVTGWAV